MLIGDTKEFSNLIEKCRQSRHTKTGLLVGNWAESKAVVYIVADTPELNLEYDNLEALLSAPLEVSGSLYTDWVLEHSKQVSRLLPGGLDLLGIWAVSNEELDLDYLQSLPLGVYSTLKEVKFEVQGGNNYVFFYYCREKNKHKAVLIDIKNKHMQNLELKLVNLLKLEEVRCKLHLKGEVQSPTLKEAAQSLVSEWSKIVFQSKVFIENADKLEMPISAVKTVIVK